MPDKPFNINIAIDGYSSCGKSTLAQDLAAHLNMTYIDSGAMYRAVTLYFQKNNVDIKDPDAVSSALSAIDISFESTNGQIQTILNGKNVESDIRSLEVSRFVSPVAAIPAVRRALVAKQQQLGTKKGVIMDGRDIGTVVFPDAELKLFITASLDERIRRRAGQLKARGIDATMDEVRDSIVRRDDIDTTRSDSPLKQASDAVMIDNTNLTRHEQLQRVLDLIEKRQIR